MTTDERRRQPRIDSHNLLSYVCLDENKVACREGMGKTLDVSEGGILLETHEPLDPLHLVSLTISLKDELINLKGKIIHSRTCEDGKYNYGIYFTRMDQNTRKILDKFITAFKKSMEP